MTQAGDSGWGAKRALAGAVLVCVGLVLAGPDPAVASLASPQIHSVAVAGETVLVRVGKRLIEFDREGRFIRERPVASPEAIESAQLVGEGGNLLWLVAPSLNKSFEVEATRLFALDGAGAIAREAQLEGDRSVRVAADGSMFVGRVAGKELVIERFEPSAATLAPWRSVTLDRTWRDLDMEAAPAFDWAVMPGGDLVVLSTRGDSGRVTRLGADGSALWTTELHPEPLTSVAYLKGISADAAGHLYVTHSSWEVSSSTENDGSVIKLDGRGRELLRFKKGIGYLQQIAIAGDGSVYLIQLGDEILRFASDGSQAGSWVAVPPEFGETWDERVLLAGKAAAATADSDLEAVVNAIVHGRWERQRQAAKWLAARGSAAIPAVTTALLRFRASWGLQSAARELWKSHPNEAVALFEKSDEATRRLMAPTIAWSVEAPVAGLLETLSAMVRDGDDAARHALDHLGATAEVVEFYVSAFRQGLREDGDFDAEWSLTRGLAANASALARIALDPRDPDRMAFQRLLLEAASDYRIEARRTDTQGQETATPALVATVQGWQSRGPVARDIAAIMLTAFGVGGHEATAVAAVEREPTWLVPTLKALSSSAAVSPAVVDGHVDRLVRLLRALPAGSPVATEAFSQFAQLPSPGVRRACFDLLRDLSVPREHRSYLLLSLDGGSIPASELAPLLADTQWQESLRDEYFYLAFLDEVLKRKDGAQREAARDRLLSLLSRPAAKTGEDAASAQGQCVQALLDALGEADGPLLEPLAAQVAQRPDLEWAVVRLAARVRPTETLRPLLEAALDKPETALDAALSLGRAASPRALDIIVEQGLKRLGHYSWIDIDVGSLRPHGARAEQSLLSVMDYPNEGTRALARVLLAELGSAEGLRVLKSEFAAAIAKKELPPQHTVTALLRGGYDVVPGLTDLAQAAPDSVSDLTDVGETLIPFLETAILAERDPARVRAQVLLLREACVETADERLEELRKRHPDPRIRALLE